MVLYYGQDVHHKTCKPDFLCSWPSLKFLSKIRGNFQYSASIMDTALPQKFPFILYRNLAKANCTGNQVCTSCDIVVLDYGKNLLLCVSFLLLSWKLSVIVFGPRVVIINKSYKIVPLKKNIINSHYITVWSCHWQSKQKVILKGTIFKHEIII